ncbi:MAG: FHIPEP family type III secretion protein, partial [Gammaproteobacteria bacterium]
ALPLSIIVRVLQNLLQEKIPVRDIRTIAETLTEHAIKTQHPLDLTEAVRTAMGRLIVQQIIGFQQELPIITLSPALEQILQKSIQNQNRGEPTFVLEPNLINRLQASIKDCQAKQELSNQPTIIVVSPVLRYPLSQLIRNLFQNIFVLSFSEIPQDKQIKITATLGDK